MTYTYAIMEISEAAFKEIKEVLEKHGYSNQIETDRDIRERTITTLIDLHGLAIREIRDYEGNIVDEQGRRMVVNPDSGIVAPPVPDGWDSVWSSTNGRWFAERKHPNEPGMIQVKLLTEL